MGPTKVMIKGDALYDAKSGKLIQGELRRWKNMRPPLHRLAGGGQVRKAMGAGRPAYPLSAWSPL